MNAATNIAHTRLVSVRRPPTMLPYAFKQALEDLEAVGAVSIAHVSGDISMVEQLVDVHALEEPLGRYFVAELEVPHGARREESRAVASSDQASIDVATPVAEKTSESQADGFSPFGGPLFGASAGGDGMSADVDCGNPTRASVSACTRVCKRAKNDRVRLGADTQAGAPFPCLPAGKVRSPGPRTRKRRVVMRAPREGSKTKRGGATSMPARKERVVKRDCPFVAAIVGGILKGLGR